MAVKAIKAGSKFGRVSVGELERYYKSFSDNPVEVSFHCGDDNFKVTVFPRLGLQELIGFVAAVVDTVFQGDNDEYHAEFAEFAIRHATMVFYTNVTLPSDSSKEFDILFGTDVYSRVVQRIDKVNYDMAVNSAFEQVEYERDLRMSEARTEVNRAIKELNDVEELYSTFMETAQKIAGPDLFDLATRLKASANNAQAAAADFLKGGDVVIEDVEKHDGVTPDS